MLSILILGCAPSMKTDPGVLPRGKATEAAFLAAIKCVEPIVEGAGFLLDRGGMQAGHLRTFTARRPSGPGVKGEQFDVVWGSILYSANGDTAWVVSSAESGIIVNDNGAYNIKPVADPAAVRVFHGVNQYCGSEQKVVAGAA